MNKVNYYKSYDEDFVKSANQNYALNSNFKWYHKNPFYHFGSFLCHIIFIIIANIYSRLFLHVHIHNRELLKKEKGYFLFANHTQMIGDILNPVLMTVPVHPYFVCSPANLGIPVLGKILPLAGALPIPDSLSKLKELKNAINLYINKGKCIVIYPEAHLWPYCTFIRPHSKSAFHFPYENHAKSFVATTTYRKGIFEKPIIDIYIDGPYMADYTLDKKEAINKLHNEIYNIMSERSKLNTYEFITYKKEDLK